MEINSKQLLFHLLYHLQNLLDCVQYTKRQDDDHEKLLSQRHLRIA